MFQFLRAKQSAPVARERLQILLAHERLERGGSDLLGKLRNEILEVVGRHFSFDPTKLKIDMQRGPEVSTLEIELELPHGATGRSAAV